ncbi:Oligopeptide transporter, putative [Candida maltosa Xu316]|uniref:Oligopeptide transporter, putative n=1 Tax=Candida maltosa (strain Xu316) TaxID=1245528 RepID=M3IIG5_CANMX|nr:Oligopeptide transporter, putative [Candida maltosa Xu316]
MIASEKGGAPAVAITSVSSRLNINDHEVDINAVTSNPLSLGEVGASLTETQKNFVLKRLHYDSLVSYDKLPPQASFIFEKIEHISTEEAVEILQKAVEEHKDDVNVLDKDEELWEKLISSPHAKPYEHKQDSTINHDDHKPSIKDKISAVFNEKKPYKDNSSSSISDADDFDEAGSAPYYKIVDWDLQVKLEAVLIAYWSPYPQVRAVTDPYDDPTIPVETVRVYIVATIWTALAAVINQFFSERQPSIGLGMSVVQVFLYPTGLLCEWILPKWKFKVWNYTIDLNPGPYTFKEQMLATIFCGVSNGTSYVSSNILMQKSELFYNNTWVDFGYQVLLTLSTNFLGFGLSGIMRQFAVYPTKAIWPSILPNLKLNKTLMSPEVKSKINGWSISSYNFFFITAGISFLYFWVPDYLFQALSTFNWITWIKPDNYDLAVVTGSVGGLGLNPIPTFDWNIIGTGNLYTPFYTTVQSYIGAVLGFFCILGLFYSNYKWTGFLPINSNRLFTNEGKPYSVSSIVNANSLFDEEKYNEVGPPFYSAANLVSYGAFFAIYPFHFVYEIVMNYKQMQEAVVSLYRGIKNFRRSTYDGFDDPHSVMMRAYPEVPEWAYLIILIVSLVLAILCVKLYPAETPVWGIFFAIGINFVFLIPLTTVQSRTMFGFGLNVLVELIVGYAIPGNGLALSFIKALGYNIDGQAQNFINDLKQGHYAKLPPRAMYRCQLISVFITSFIQLGILNYQITGIKDYCFPNNRQKFTCPGTVTFYNASVLWGVIGPKKVFNGLYPILQWCFLIGFLLAFPCILYKKFAPRRYSKYFEPSIIIGGFLSFAPYNLSYLTGGLYVGWAFMHYIKNRYEAWWQKYNYIFATGLSAGIAFSSIIIFFAVMYHDKSIDWWGNDVMYEGWDGSMSVGYLNATLQAPDGYFGPRKGHFP